MADQALEDAGASTLSAGTRTPSNDTSCWASCAKVESGMGDTPGASVGTTTKRTLSAAVADGSRATTTRSWATPALGTNSLVPWTTTPSPSGATVVDRASGDDRMPASWSATETMRSPASTAGRPPPPRPPPPGRAGRRLRRRPTRGTPGRATPTRPSPPRGRGRAHRRRGFARAGPGPAGTPARGTPAPRPGAPPARPTAPGPSPRQPVAALGDDVALDLVGAAAEAQVRRRPVHQLGQAGDRRPLVVGIELAVQPHQVQRQRRGAGVELGREDLGHRRLGAGGPASVDEPGGAG